MSPHAIEEGREPARNLRSRSGGLMSHRTEGDTSMEFFRTLNRALAGLADRLQGQDVERSAAPEGRRGADQGAIMRSHHRQRIRPLGPGRYAPAGPAPR